MQRMESINTNIRGNIMKLQQGDVCIESSTIPISAKKKEGLIVAEGETTGHAHRLVVLDGAVAELFQEEKGNLYLRVDKGTVELVHEEHKVQTIPQGEYVISRIFEYDYDTEEKKYVQD